MNHECVIMNAGEHTLHSHFVNFNRM